MKYGLVTSKTAAGLYLIKYQILYM